MNNQTKDRLAKDIATVKTRHEMGLAPQMVIVPDDDFDAALLDILDGMELPIPPRIMLPDPKGDDPLN